MVIIIFVGLAIINFGFYKIEIGILCSPVAVAVAVAVAVRVAVVAAVLLEERST